MRKLTILAFLIVCISISFNANCQKTNIDSLFSVVVTPINNINEVIKSGIYTYVDDSINEKNVPLQTITESKRIYFVSNEDKYLSNRDLEIYLNKRGLILCKNAPNYLVGAMSILSKNKIPVALKDKQFVALELNTSSIFTIKNDTNNYLLRVDTRDLTRKLLFVRFNPELNDEFWPKGYGWVFLAEKP